MTKIKRVLRQGFRWPMKTLRKIDRKVQRAFTKFFRKLYRIKFLRPLTKPVYRFVHHHHRITASMLAVLIVTGVAIPVLQPYLKSQRYELTSQAQELLGQADKDLTKKLTYDDQKQLYQFNKDAKKPPVTDGNPLARLQSQIGGGGEKDNQLYSVDVSKDLSQGITYYDNQMDLSFKLIPQFQTLPGEQKEGHLIYPLNGSDGQLAYTVGAGGLKENMVLYKSPGNQLKMSYKLDLPKSLEARIIESTGEIGIYSADPVLFGNISYGSSNDQAKVEAARNNSEKTYLTFKIPAPVVLGLGKVNQASIAAVKSKFVLNNNTLSVVTTGLEKAEYPLSIDPTVTVDSSSDFQTGNMEDNNLSVSSGDLNRGGVTGGSVASSYSSGTVLPVSLGYHDAIAYNGYMYVVGGWNDSVADVNSVRYATINSDGTLGSWTSTTNLSHVLSYHKAFAYNGYMYVVGGWNGSATINEVRYAPINSDGTIGSWSGTTGFTTAREGHAAAIYNGYMYVGGGDTGSGYLSDVQYAPINADGTVGTWNSTTSISGGALAGHSFVAYNGYMYRVGGDFTATVDYAPINADGTLGSWTATTSMPAVRYDNGATIYNGYLYVAAGSGASGLSSVLYAPISANGTIGAWQTTTSLASNRAHLATVAYNGYLYNVGGDSVGGTLTDVKYAAISSPGVTNSWTSTTSFTTGRERSSIAVYNGYIYLMGGRKGASSAACRNSGSAVYCNDTQYAPLNANGTIGTWTTGTYFTTPRYGHTSVAYNGYMYIIGGNDGSSNLTSVQSATINASTGALGAWGANTALGTGRREHTSVVYNGYAYVLGGNTGSAANTVNYASINPTTGVLGTWTSTTAFTTARQDHASVVYGGNVYVIGGTKGTSNSSCRDSGSAAICNDVQYAPLNSNGTVGTWTTTTYFSTARDSLTAAVHNGYLYVIGGNTGSQTNNVQAAPINSDGSTGTWVATANLGTARSAHVSAAYNGYLYTMGGFGGGYLATTEYAQVNNGSPGTVGTWTSTTAFSTARKQQASVAYNGYIYVIGGVKSASSSACRSSGSGTYCDDVQYAALSATGTIGSWSSTSSFSTPRSAHAAVAYNGYMYILGGYDGSYYSDVQYAAINSSNGTLGSWSSTTAFTNARSAHTAVAYNGYMYVVGGYGGSGRDSSIYYAAINSNGTVGSWSSTTALSTGTYYHTAVAYNGYMYVMGGYTTTQVADVQYAAINSNGTLGSWTATTSLRTARYAHTSIGYNGYLYVIGGYDGTNELNSVELAPVNSNGTLGPWQSTTGFTTARDSHSSVVYNGYTYVLGGNDGSYYNTTQYAPISSMPRTAHYSKLIDFNVLSNVSSIAYTGTLPGDTTSITYKVASESGVFGSAKKIADGYTCLSSDAGRYIQVFVTLDDSQVGTFRDALNTNNAKVSSLTISSKPLIAPPDKRLRHGAWFLNEAQRPFTATTETCN